LRIETPTSPISRAVVGRELLQLSATSKKSTSKSDKTEAAMINAARYVQTLNKLRRALREKHPKKKTVILQLDNAKPHNARLTWQTIRKNG
jgi:hypothetical protein